MKKNEIIIGNDKIKTEIGFPSIICSRIISEYFARVSKYSTYKTKSGFIGLKHPQCFYLGSIVDSKS